MFELQGCCGLGLLWQQLHPTPPSLLWPGQSVAGPSLPQADLSSVKALASRSPFRLQSTALTAASVVTWQNECTSFTWDGPNGARFGSLSRRRRRLRQQVWEMFLDFFQDAEVWGDKLQNVVLMYLPVAPVTAQPTIAAARQQFCRDHREWTPFC